MSPRPPGSVVTLTNDRPGSGREGPEEGDVLETRTGRRYLIVERRPVGEHRARYSCVVMDPADPYPPGAVRWSWEWTPRTRRR